MGYKRYERYKDSGVDWIGEVPEGWEVNRLKNSIKSCKNGIWGKEPEGNHNDIPCIRVADFDRNNLVVDINDITYRNYSENKQREYLLNVGDLLIEKSGGGEKQLVGFVVSYNHQLPAVYSNFIARMELKKNLAYQGYFKYVHAAMYSVRLNLRSIKQTTGIQNLDTGYYFEEIVPYPLLTEQKNIANFLNQKTAEIDSLIADKEKMVQLLQEMRQAIISEAVTKGLDKNVKMKDSGVEWIGEIPEHWEVKKLRFLCKIETGNKDTQDSDENGIYPFFVRSDTIEYINSYSFDGEAILTAGDGVGVARVFHYINGKFDFHQRVYKISDFKEISGKLLFYYIKENLYKEVIKISAKSTVDSLRMPMFKNFPVVYDKNESNQQKIVNYLDRNTSAIDMIINKTQLQIEKLHEYRQSLISEAVTGKIDVRDFMHSTEGGVQNGCNAG